ncbi:MAG: hypothetical protein ACOC43_00435 [Desulfohalobiaceae bacterium]
MRKKKVLLLTLFIVLILGALSGWYLFQQSSRLSRLDSDTQSQESEDNGLQDAEPLPVQRESDFVQDLRDKIPDPHKALMAQAEQQAREQQEHKKSWWSWIQDYVLTNYFIQDLAEYIVAHYVPPGSKDNSGEQGKSRLSFKSLNARYGLELTGFRYQDDPQEARQKILERLMDREVLERIYAKYADDFLEQFLQEAKQRKWKFEDSDGQVQERGLNQEELADLLQTKSRYIRVVGRVFQTLAQDQKAAQRVQEYLQQEQEAVHANYELNQEQNRLQLLRRQAKKEDEKDPGLEEDIAQAEQKKEQAVQDYRQAIQNREKAREAVIKSVRANSSFRHMESHEILYIAEWVQRRFVQGQDHGAVARLAQLLQDLGQRLTDKAQELQG